MSKSKTKSSQLKKRELKRKLKQLTKTGLYNPKSQEITPYRAKRINSLYKEYRSELENPNVLFVKFPKFVSPQKMQAKAKSLKFKASRKGLFIEKEGSRSGSIEYNRTLGEYQIKLTGKRKSGPRKGTKITKTFPLSNMMELDRQRERFREEFENLNRKKNEYARIRVTETGNDGFSSTIFSRFDDLMSHLDNYQKSVSDRIQFYRLIGIEKVTKAEHAEQLKQRREKAKATKKRKTDKTGRSI